MWAGIALVVLAAVPSEYVARDAADMCDVVEVNHVYYLNTGNHAYTQLIWYDWLPGSGKSYGKGQVGRYVKRGSRLIGAKELPIREGDVWAFRRLDCDSEGRPVQREIRAASKTESWSQYDVARGKRKGLPLLFDAANWEHKPWLQEFVQ